MSEVKVPRTLKRDVYDLLMALYNEQENLRGFSDSEADAFTLYIDAAYDLFVCFHPEIFQDKSKTVSDNKKHFGVELHRQPGE